MEKIDTLYILYLLHVSSASTRYLCGESIVQRVMKDYAHLQWDRAAARNLAFAYLSSGNPEEAYKACKSVVDGDPSAAWKGELAPAYWQTLLKLNRKQPLEAALGKAAASGDRFASASALTLRGDLILATEGDGPEALRKALTEGYLRVALMYRGKDVGPRVCPEALYKAAQCFEKLGLSGRVETMRSTLKKEFAASPWAAK